MVVSPATAVATTSLTGITPATINPSSTVYDAAGNLFIDDAINARILESTSFGSATVLGAVPSSNTIAPFSSIAIAGDGTLYVSSPNTGTIYQIPPGGSPVAMIISGVTLVQPAGLALDGYGYLYVADAGTNQIVRIDVENGNQASALTLTGLSTPLASPEGLAVDDSDNLYVADAANNRVVEIDLHTSVSLTNAATVLPVSGLTLSNPEAVTVNAAGGLTIADTGNSRLVELPLSGSPYVITLIGATLNTPAGLTLLPTGDLLVSDTVAGLVQVTRSTSALTFNTPTLVGFIDSVDGDLALNVENTGTVVLNASGSITNNAFFVDNTGTCPNAASGSTQIPVGDACTIELGFKPTIAGTNTGTLNVSGNGNVSAAVTLTGTGYHILDHFNVSVAPSTVTPGEATTLTITAINNDGTVDTTYTGTLNLTCTDPACQLPTGSYTFTTANNGTIVFSSTAANPLNFNTLGVWTVTVTDMTTTSGQTYTGTSNQVTVVTTPAVSLTSSVNPVNVGANTTLTATVSSSYGTPTGSVTFMDGATILGTGPLNSSGVATLTVAFSTPGTHPLTASYPGTLPYQAATSPAVNEIVQSFSSSATLTSSVNPVLLSSPTVLTATLTSTTGTPTGTITFYDGAASIGTATLNANGVATLNATFSTNGQHILTFVYGGGGAFQPITSPKLTQVVEDFSLALATGSQSSATIILGASTQYGLVVAPIGATTLAAPVALSVTGLPSGASASFNPTTAAGGDGTTPIVLTVNGPPITSSLRRPANPASPSYRGAPAFLALLLLPASFLARRRRSIARLLILLVGIAAATGLTGCLSDQSTGYYGQMPQTYTLTVTGTSGTLTHSVQVTLTVD
jgi:sugar lactone lactonase YvrE